jgi:hypothetical protein
MKYLFPQCKNIFERSIGIGSILDELNTFFFGTKTNKKKTTTKNTTEKT